MKSWIYFTIFSGKLNDSILVKFLIYRRLSELSESLNVLSDIHFHLKNCINIQFHCYYHLKYQFVYRFMKKITMENLDRIWTEFGRNLDEKVERIKEKIFHSNILRQSFNEGVNETS